jgi:DNA-binding transcriptional MerR regulator
MMKKTMMKAGEIEARTGVRADTVRQWFKRGKIRSSKEGDRRKYCLEDVRELQAKKNR